jgi:transposase
MPRYTQPRKTWQYSNEFKVKAVELSKLEDIKIKDVAAALDIHPFMLSRWRKEYREGTIVAKKGKSGLTLQRRRRRWTAFRNLKERMRDFVRRTTS